MSRRVLVVTNMWPGEGSRYAGIFVRRQVEALRAAAPDWTFDVFSFAGPRGRKDYLLAVPRLRRRLRAGYDLVHAHYGFSGATAALAGARPLVTTLHGGDVDIGWQRPFTRFAARRSALVIAVSERLRDSWGDDGLPILPCGVPTDLFRLLDRDEARARLGIDPAARVVLFPADPAIPVKDYPLFEAAVARLPAELRGRVVTRVLGAVEPEDAPWHVAAADVVVLTSRQESGPLVVKEALACGVPVVAVRVGDVPETLGGVEGCAVVPRDPDRIAEAVAGVIEAAERGERPEPESLRRRIFEIGLDDGSIAVRLLALYREVLAGQVRRDPRVRGRGAG